MEDKRFNFYINSGKYKNTKLSLDVNSTTRPTKMLVKKSFISTIKNDLINASFIEGFTGSGSIGFEAISNLAKELIFFEKDRLAFNNLLKNIKALKQKDESIDIKAYNKSFFNILELLDFKEKKYILYLDPPFNIRDGFSDIYEKLQDFITSLDIKISKNIDIIIIEASSNAKLSLKLGYFTQIKIKKFGATSLIYYTKET